MNQTHTSYSTSKKLKAFLGESAPEPISGEKYEIHAGGICPILRRGAVDENAYRKNVPAYQLHDLLSRPFCEAMEKASATKAECLVWKYILAEKMASAYFNDGLPAVEKLLLQMMNTEVEK